MGGTQGLLLFPPLGAAGRPQGGPEVSSPFPASCTSLKVGRGLLPGQAGGDGGAPEKSCFEEQGRSFAPFEGQLGQVMSLVVGPQVDTRTEGDESQVSL